MAYLTQGDVVFHTFDKMGHQIIVSGSGPRELCPEIDYALVITPRAQGCQALALLRLDGGIKFQEVDINLLIRETMNLLAGKIRASGINLKTSLPEALPPLEGDPKQLSQVFLNLIQKAI